MTANHAHIQRLLLALFIILYAAYFSWYSINRHNTLNSYAADLSLIDQPMWNTARGPGGFMELTWGDRQQPRLAEHFEPILVPLSLLFFLWDDVRLLLIIQSVALAVGALPVFWLARQQLSAFSTPAVGWVALALAGAYLLSPHLQAANVADFHADPLVVAPLLFAFWYATRRRWGLMWLWAIVVMATKETLPTLAAMLGLWLLVQGRVARHRPRMAHGLGLLLAGTGWFLVATFLVVAPLARQYFGTAGPIYLASRYGGGPWALLQEPARWQYLLGLLAAVGFLPLLAPELLLLGLPVLAANFFSQFPGQYSGEQHYSAPLVAVFIIAAIYGARRLVSRASRYNPALQRTALICVGLWLAGWALGYQARQGWTPLSTHLESYHRTPAAARLADFTAPIPPQAVVSASAAVHPHLAHRRAIYVFPTVEKASYLLVDVTDIPGVHPNDAQAQILAMLKNDWRLLAADQGLILAQNSPGGPPSPGPCTGSLPLPCPFYDFARPTAGPTYPTDLAFGGGRLKLVGYDVHDDPDDGVSFRLHWQATGPLPAGLRLWPLVYNDLGQLLADPTQVPMIAALWYPPAAWPPGEAVVTETLPQHLPDAFHLGLAVGPEGSFNDPAQRWPPEDQAATWAQAATFRRQGPFLLPLPPRPTLQTLTPADVQFGSHIHLGGYRLGTARPGQTLPILLQWTATRPVEADYTVFIHLLAPDGRLVAQSDAMPTWLDVRPTSGWSPNRPQLDRHLLELPPDLPPAVYTLQLGLYHQPTMERLARPNGSDTFTLGQLRLR